MDMSWFVSNPQSSKQRRDGVEPDGSAPIFLQIGFLLNQADEDLFWMFLVLSKFFSLVPGGIMTLSIGRTTFETLDIGADF